jgi:hypothetical protein
MLCISRWKRFEKKSQGYTKKREPTGAKLFGRTF